MGWVAGWVLAAALGVGSVHRSTGPGWVNASTRGPGLCSYPENVMGSCCLQGARPAG